MSITHAGEELQWAYRGMSAPLAHRHYDTFELPEAPERLLPDRLAISFGADREGNISVPVDSVRSCCQRHRLHSHCGRRLRGSDFPQGLHRHVQPPTDGNHRRTGEQWAVDPHSWEPANLRAGPLPGPNLRHRRVCGFSRGISRVYRALPAFVYSGGPCHRPPSRDRREVKP